MEAVLSALFVILYVLIRLFTAVVHAIESNVAGSGDGRKEGGA
jgi:hypothetical protein